MDRVLCFSVMGIGMRGSLRMICLRGMGYWRRRGKEKGIMREILRMGRSMDLELAKIVMELPIKDNMRIIRNMVQERKFSLMEMNIMDNLLMELSKNSTIL